MGIIIGIIICVVVGVVSFVLDDGYGDNGRGFIIFLICFVLGIGLVFFGCVHGFINYPATNGTHQGTLTAVDMEGYFFRRYKVYLKSSAFTEQGDETTYCVYLNETDLSDELKEAIGKKVKLYYSHPGGYIGYNSCGTYHIDKVEVIDDNSGDE